NYSSVDTINKDDLLNMIDLFVNNECEMDEYSEVSIPNKAHQIIYQNIYRKFKELEQNKAQFKDMSENTYKDAIDKYRD
ncbi:hypothetical protein, partial [Odoribacter laneus]